MAKLYDEIINLIGTKSCLSRGTYSYRPFNSHQGYLRKYNKSFRNSMYLHIGTIYSSEVVIKAILESIFISPTIF